MSFPSLCCRSHGNGSFLIGVCRYHASSATSSRLPRAHFITFSHCMRNPCWDFNGNYIKSIHQCGGNCHLYSVDPPHSWTSSLCFSNFISSAILNFFFNIQFPHTFCWVHNRIYVFLGPLWILCFISMPVYLLLALELRLINVY